MLTQSNDCRNVLLADDGSEYARAAATMVSSLPFTPQCRVTVLRVFGSQQAAELGLLEEALAKTCEILKSKGLQVYSELLLGSPAQKINEYAEEHKVDLIVMGAKGLRATLGILLGGVAQQVVEYSSCPVLVVRPPQTNLKRILLIMDGSAYGQQALEYLGSFPFPETIDLRVMHVLLPPPFPAGMAYTATDRVLFEPLAISEALAEERAREEAAGNELLAKAVDELHNLGREAKAILKRGDAATEILEYIKQENVDLVVCGSRGMSPIRSWLMGNVSRKLVHYSHSSVMVVRRPG